MSHGSGVDVEDLSQRSESVRAIVHPDGSVTQEAHAAAVWVKNDDGNWVDVDYALTPRSGGGFVPKASSSPVVIDGGGAKEFARLDLPGGGSTVWSWPKALPEPHVEGATAVYAVADGVDLLVTATGSGVSTRIRINTPEAVAPEFTVQVRTEGVDLSQTATGRLVFTDGDSTAGHTATLLAWDARRDQFGDPVEVVPVEVDLDRTATKGERTDQHVTLTTPTELVNDPEVEYPIVVDPDLSPMSPSQDTWVRQSTTSIENGYRLMVGRLDGSSNSNPTISYVQWPNTRISGRAVTSASMYLFQYAAGSCSSRTMNIHPLRDAWSDATTVYSNKPTAMTTTGTSSTLTKNVGGEGCGTANGYVSADITKIVKAWADGPSNGGFANNGIQLNVPSDNASTVSYERRFCSVNPDPTHTSCVSAAQTPYLTVTLAADASLPGGSRSPQVMVSDQASVELQADEEPLTPLTFAVDGTVAYLADQVNNTIRIYNNGVFSRAVPTGDLYPIDLAATSSGLVMLDLENRVQRINLSGAALQTMGEATQLSVEEETWAEGTVTTGTTTEVKALKADVTPVRIDLVNGALVAVYEDGTTKLVDSNASSQTGMSETVQSSDTGYIITTDTGVQKRISLLYEPDSVERIYADAQSSFYLVTASYDNTSGTATHVSYVYKFTNGTTPAATYTMLPSDSSSPSREIQINQGRVYQLRTTGNTAQVLQLTPDTAGGFVEATDYDNSTTSDSDDVSTADKPHPVSLLQVEIATDEMATHKWTYTSSTNGDHKPALVKQPRYLRDIDESDTAEGSGKVKGVPYAYGGMDATAALGGSFDTKVKNGWYTGNTSDAAGQYVSGTTGVDCSGLVSISFSLPKIKANSLIGSSYFKSIKKKNRKPGDIIQHPGHVVIYLGPAKHGKWRIAESTTTAATNDRVVIRNRPPGAYSGWHWGRYRNFDPRGLND